MEGTFEGGALAGGGNILQGAWKGCKILNGFFNVFFFAWVVEGGEL